MRGRTLVGVLLSGTVGAAILLVLVPWVDPCASDFEMIVCDFFPSPWESIVRSVTVVAVVTMCGAFGAYLAGKLPAFSGAAAAGVQFVAAVTLFFFMFETRITDLDSVVLAVLLAMSVGAMALGALGGLVCKWLVFRIKEPNKPIQPTCEDARG